MVQMPVGWMHRTCFSIKVLLMQEGLARLSAEVQDRWTDFTAAPVPWSRVTEQFVTFSVPQFLFCKCRLYGLIPGFIFFIH